MSESKSYMPIDLERLDAVPAEPDDDAPEVTEADLARATWRIGDRVVSEAEGRAAMAASLTGLRQHVELDLPGDVLAAYRAGGPDWRDRMAQALRKAVGL